jgi:molybdenum cofactor cytidylyltransferase
MDEPVALHELATALRLGGHELVSLVGGGGKTTTLFALGRQLPGHLVLTTTTKMSGDRTDRHRVLLDPTDAEVAAAAEADQSVLVWRSISGNKAHGVDRGSCDRWFDLVDHVLVEADGARRRPLTAPGPFEPVVPSRTTTLVACVGASAFGRVIADRCHRPLRVAALAGCSPYERLTPERVARVLLSDRGLRKDQPATARFAVLAAGVAESDRPFLRALVTHLDGRVPVVAVAHSPNRRR